MFARALFAFLALPGIVAIAIPGWLAWSALRAGERSPPSLSMLGIAVLLTGFALLLWCVRAFYVAGKGTLAPWSPPQHLVTSGLYRFSRNPMYVAVAAMLFGWFAIVMTFALITYAVFVITAFNLRVIVGEEPWLARRYGAEWDEYKARVPRWLIFR